VAADLAVQIVNYKTREHLERCLPSVLADLGRSDIAHEVLVLDNASGDDLSQLESRFEGAVSFHRSDTNLGYGGGHNLLAAHAATKYLCCLNPDVELHRPGVFAGLLRHFANRSVAAAGPLLRTTADEPQRWDHGELRGLRARVANGAGHAHWRPRTEPARVAWVSGAMLVLRRSAFDEVGGFDERFFLYKEEEDLCLQLRRKGWRIVYDPRVQARHVGSVVADRDEGLEQSRELYYAKNHPGARRAVLELLYRHVTRRI
jgi:GT2 family glycosyltransferase